MTNREIKTKLEKMTKKELQENLDRVNEEISKIESMHEDTKNLVESLDKDEVTNKKYEELVREHNMTWRKLKEGTLHKMTMEDWD